MAGDWQDGIFFFASFVVCYLYGTIDEGGYFLFYFFGGIDRACVFGFHRTLVPGQGEQKSLYDLRGASGGFRGVGRICRGIKRAIGR